MNKADLTRQVFMAELLAVSEKSLGAVNKHLAQQPGMPRLTREQLALILEVFATEHSGPVTARSLLNNARLAFMAEAFFTCVLSEPADTYEENGTDREWLDGVVFLTDMAERLGVEDIPIMTRLREFKTACDNLLPIMQKIEDGYLEQTIRKQFSRRANPRMQKGAQA